MSEEATDRPETRRTPSSPLSRRIFLRGGAAAGIGAAGFSLLPTGAAGRAASGPATRPNIVLIVADDLGYSDLGCYGSEISTPNLDRLGFGGVRLTQMYGNSVCAPARASLLTGLYPTQAGVGFNGHHPAGPQYQGYLNDNCVTAAEVLGLAGYRTGMAGKWHIGGRYDPVFSDDISSKDGVTVIPATRGFERSFGMLHGADSFFNTATLFRNDARIRPEGDNFYMTDAVSEEVVAQIDAFSTGSDPFFIYAAYSAPHWPLQALPEDIEKYRGKYLAGWDKIRERRWQRQKELGIADPRWEFPRRDSSAPAWESVPFKDWQDAQMAVYAAMVERMDRGVGNIMAKLREQGLEENTLVLFMSDNGADSEYVPGFRNIDLRTRDGRRVRWGNDPDITPGPSDTWQSYGTPWANASNSPFSLYKHFTHEGGISSPTIAYWPGVIEGGRIERRPLHFIDVMPTFVDVAGAEYPAEREGKPVIPVEGTSFAGLLSRGRGGGQGSQMFFGEVEGNRVAREGRWKAVSNFPGDWELYDIGLDRTEQDDLAEDGQEILQELAAGYEQWAERVDVIDWQDLVGYDSDDLWRAYPFGDKVREIGASGEFAQGRLVKENLNDDDMTTKWLVFSSTPWVQYRLWSRIAAVRYSLMSADNLPDRDPREWQLQASHDGKTWTTLDSRAGEVFTERFQRKEYWFDNRAPYEFEYYRLNITRNNGSSITQLAEWGISDDRVAEIAASGEDARKGEVKENLNDDDPTTKWLVKSRTAWVQYKLWAPIAMVSYMLRSADDHPEWDPRDWQLQASDDGKAWMTLDSRAGEVFTERFQRKEYRFENPTEYRFYRLSITRNNGGPRAQLAEWELSDETPHVTIVEIAASGESPGLGHPKEYLNDDAPATKWLVKSRTAWLQYRLSSPIAVKRYALTAANDIPDRDPQDWQLQGSHDGQNWTTLDTRAGQVFAERFQRKEYRFENGTAYEYYRLNITRNSGASETQLAEWGLL